MKELVKNRKQLGVAPSPCAACKLLRRRCTQNCMFAPYFPADEPHKFAYVHKVFGASNVNKLLQELPEQYRSDAVSSMVYEANARVRDPIYGCVGAISSLQQQIDLLQTQLAITQAEMVHMRTRHSACLALLRHSPGKSTTTVAAADESGSSSSATTTNFMELHSDEKAQFGLEMVVDQTKMSQLMWLIN